jgi:heat shock protein HspQ
MAAPPRKRSTASAPQHDQSAKPTAAPKDSAAKPAAKSGAAKAVKTAATKPITKPAEPPTQSVKQKLRSATAAPKQASTQPVLTDGSTAPKALRQAKFSVGAVVKHRVYPFRGVVFDIDPVFNNTEDWWQAIPEEIRPRKDQPFYHLLAENAETTYVAYVSEQNLLADKTGRPVRHPQVREMFALDAKGQYRARFLQSH